MTRLFNDPAAFADEMTEGFVAANGRWVRHTSGGVVRSTATPPGTVAVVVGGGSGHYPAFAGLVGQGLASAAVIGNVFASPSAQQVTAVSKAADHGGGVLLAYGNYAGDCLNFDAAQERLRGAGIRVETVRVTDDIFSAPDAERHKRRGIAGDLVVFKVAGAAADEGMPLEVVSALANRANDRTRSMGVAFSGCTLPGAGTPLFTVPDGKMAIGLGIHGEPGFAEADLPTADELATLLVERLLTELPDGVVTASGARVAVLLNGLGSVKQEELFVVYRRVNHLLGAAGLTVVAPEVGELCTSFDMAGVSLTLTWLDDDLERLWTAPADTPAFHRGAIHSTVADTTETLSELAAELPQGSPASQAAAARVVAVLTAARDVVDANVDDLGRIDAVAGDGDHGIGMQRGIKAAVDAAADAQRRRAGAGTVLIEAADAWSDRAGGTSGALWGIALRRIGQALGDQDHPTPEVMAAAVRAARDGICDIGGAQLGDKTMVDVLIPLDESFAAAVADGASVTGAWGVAADAAERAAEATKNLLPRMGRARPHAEKSLGTPDAGAVSMSLIARTVHTVLSTPATTTGE
ncbi:dihydroxyacetone kinase family protein [Actinoplanes derwentensis]|uniref:Homodimeric dihydroxyacetone kinase n=1 Tax=Actinoplanes derwentensis TaxID=113562 RepID=A0A1H1ZVF5_9ACTN|nr:dihydroxyacetone kinase family protein [Actinoplanes derwentensis]GID83545.1 erythrulose kinase [Actinoplanes derwentensis]SDT37236.1 homodimeric dihydroxyacetone kinase [Actinoplanes derwentensis]